MKYLILSLLMLNTVYAADEMQLNLSYSSHLNVTRVEAMYQSNKNVPGCGKFDSGSVRPKFKFEDFEASEFITLPKEIKKSFFSCTYVLSALQIFVINPSSGYEIPYTDQPVINRFNRKYYDDVTLSDTYFLKCTNGDNYGCNTPEEYITIEFDNLSIIMK